MKTKPSYWFPAKKYGWGWSFPCTWQGWVVFGLFITAVTVWSVVFPPVVATGMFITGMVLLTLLFVGICWWKGEPPAWRWGNSDASND